MKPEKAPGYWPMRLALATVILMPVAIALLSLSTGSLQYEATHGWVSLPVIAIGALLWLPDIEGWARVVADCLTEGGRLYVYEAHPMLLSLRNDASDSRTLEVRYPYFELADPTAFDGNETYVDGPRLEVTRNYEWNHGLGQIVTALVEAGLVIEFLHEHREVPWQALPWMEFVGDGPRGADGRYQSGRMWRLPEAQRELVPLMYSLMARKPISD